MKEKGENKNTMSMRKKRKTKREARVDSKREIKYDRIKSEIYAESPHNNRITPRQTLATPVLFKWKPTNPNRTKHSWRFTRV